MAITFFCIFSKKTEAIAFEVNEKSVFSQQVSAKSEKSASDMLGQYRLDSPYEMPRIPYYDVEGKERFFNILKGKAVFLSFWASWCKECVKDLVQLNKIQDNLNYHKNDSIAILTISNDFKSSDVLKGIIKSNGVSLLPLHIDKKRQLSDAMSVNSLPSFFIIDERGYVTHHITQHMNLNNQELYQVLLNMVPQKNKIDDKQKEGNIMSVDQSNKDKKDGPDIN